MIKFLATRGDRQILGLGISRENVNRLTEDMPIHFNAEDMGLVSINVKEVVIFFGETEEDVYEIFKKGGAITDKTKVFEERERKIQ